MIAALLRDINLIIALLLLTGQITIVAIFVESSGFGIAIGGPITGSLRLRGKTKSDLPNKVIDIIDIVLAVLLIADKIGIIGIFVGPKRFNIVVSGPIFGHPKTVADVRTANKWKRYLRRLYRMH